MSQQRLELGKKGEDAAIAFLKKTGYRIIKRNYKNKLGEIDIVAKEKGTICFVEVKTRTTLAFGYPQEAITTRKQKQLNRVALSYMKQYNLLHVPARFDVVSVMVNVLDGIDTTVIRDAFPLLHS